MDNTNQANPKPLESSPIQTPEVTQPVVPSSEPPATGTPNPVIVEPSSSVNSTPAPRKLNIPKIDPKTILPMIKQAPLKFKIMGGVVFTLVFLLLIASFTKPGKSVVQKLILPTSSPIPTVTPIGDVFVPSPYNEDSEVLDNEKKLSEFEQKLRDTNLNDDTLRPPSLDWSVNFKSQ